VVVVAGRAGGAGDERVHAVGADDDPRVLGPPARVDAGDAVALRDEAFDRELLADHRAREGGLLDEDLVEDGAAQRVAVRDRPDRRRRAAKGERPEIERVVTHAGRARRDDPRQQAPAVQARDAGLVDVVGRQRVAREAGPVHQQHAVAFAREQHRRR
jgi:hypothetical protein